MEISKNFNVKSLCVFEHEGKFLVQKSKKSKNTYRFLGGGIEFGETALQAIHREILEELKSEIKNVEFLEVIENIFERDGEKQHRITFLYRAELLDKTIYKKDSMTINDEGKIFEAVWVPLDHFKTGKAELHPVFDFTKYF